MVSSEGRNTHPAFGTPMINSSPLGTCCVFGRTIHVVHHESLAPKVGSALYVINHANTRAFAERELIRLIRDRGYRPKFCLGAPDS